MLLGLEEVHKNHSDFLPDVKDVINFGKRREYAKLIQELQRYQTYPYNLHPIEVNKYYLIGLLAQSLLLALFTISDDAKILGEFEKGIERSRT